MKECWRQGSLEDKDWFAYIFNQDGFERFGTVRKDLADTVYQPIQHLGNARVNWLSAQEVDRRIHHVWNQVNIKSRPFFYHATSERSLESILKSKKIEVRHEKAFRGAFVSTKPETGFGRCILALKRNVERLSPLDHGFSLGQNTYWAGFSRAIPVTESTLAYIILDRGNNQECQELEVRCQQWTDRQIRVISLDDAGDHLRAIQHLDTGIPFEWPSDDERGMGLKILSTLQARAVAALPVMRQRVRQPMMMVEAY